MHTLYIVFFSFFVIVNLQSQSLYDWKVIQEIKIEFKESNWEQVLDSLKERGEKDRLIGEVTINGKKYKDCGIRYKGNSSYASVRKAGDTKLPFNIKSNEIEKGQRFPDGVKTLKLSNVFRDPTYIREILSYEIARNYMPAPRANFAKVYVNNTYLGLYNNVETIDEDLLETAFNHKDGIFVKCDPEDWNLATPKGCKKSDKASLMYLGDDPSCYYPYYELKTKEGWAPFIKMIQQLNEKPETIESSLDVDQTLWMLAFNNVLVNLDSYSGRLCHNYYMYRNESQQFVPMVWDMNLSFGGFQYDGEQESALSLVDMQTMSPFAHYKSKNSKRPLIVQLLSQERYRKIYVGHIYTILQDFFVKDQYLARAKELQSVVKEALKEKGASLYDYATFEENLYRTVDAKGATIPGIEELMKARTAHLVAHPLLSVAPPTVTKSTTPIIRSEKVEFAITTLDTEKVWLMVKTSKDKPFEAVAMEKKDANNQWQTTLPKSPNMEYYYILEGARFSLTYPNSGSWKSPLKVT